MTKMASAKPDSQVAKDLPHCAHLTSHLDRNAAWWTASSDDCAINIGCSKTQVALPKIGGQPNHPKSVLPIQLAGHVLARTEATSLTSGSAPVALETGIVSTSFIEVI